MKPIFIAASPNTQLDDVNLAYRILLWPFSWKRRSATAKFEKEMEQYLGVKHAVAFDSARTSLYMLLKSFGVKHNDEVILPAFSCLVIVNPVLWLGAKPVYADVGPDFNIDVAKIKKLISPRTKAILVQHTFGKPVDIKKIREVVGAEVKIIEDTAHSLGGDFQKSKLGTLGDAAILTFGIEKMISTVRGGMAVTNNSELAGKLKSMQLNAKDFSYKRIYFSLLNPIIWFLLTPVYYWGVGKLTIGRIFAWIFHRIGIFGNMIEKVEYKSEKPEWFPAKLPGALAELGLKQLKKLDGFNKHRWQIASIYASELDLNFDPGTVYLRFPVLVENRSKLIRVAKNNRVVLGDWYKTILYSPENNLKYFGYKTGDNPEAEEYAKHIVNLPTGPNVNEEAAKKIAALVKPFLK